MSAKIFFEHDVVDEADSRSNCRQAGERKGRDGKRNSDVRETIPGSNRRKRSPAGIEPHTRSLSCERPARFQEDGRDERVAEPYRRHRRYTPFLVGWA